MRRNLLPLVLMALLTACGTFYTGVVSLTVVMDDAAKQYAALYNQGLVPAPVAAQASLAHAEYRKAAGVARRVLEATKAGQGGDEKAALEAARVAANHFVDVVFTLLPVAKAEALRAGVKEASVL